MAIIDWPIGRSSGLFYFMVGLTLDINLWLTVLLIMLAHSASGANWVLDYFDPNVG